MRISLFVLLILILGSAVPIHARLGETEDQCTARYGPVVKRNTSTTTGKPLPTLVFVKNGYTFFAILLDGKVGFLEIGKADQADLSENEIDTFLEANSDGQKWAKDTADVGKVAWFRDDGDQAQYDTSGHGLCLISKPYIDAVNTAKKAAENKNLNGF